MLTFFKVSHAHISVMNIPGSSCISIWISYINICIDLFNIFIDFQLLLILITNNIINTHVAYVNNMNYYLLKLIIIIKVAADDFHSAIILLQYRLENS